MFFGKSKKRKSYTVGTPEYNQYEESDNTQDMLDLQERMRKHGFKGGLGINKDRWTYGDDIFDIDRPAGGAVQIWSMKDADYNRLKDLLDRLDTDKPKLKVKNVDDNYNGSFVDAGVLSGMLTDTPEIRNKTIKYIKSLTGDDLNELNKIISSQTFKDMYGEPDWEGTDQYKHNTKVGNIAKSIAAYDVGRISND